MDALTKTANSSLPLGLELSPKPSSASYPILRQGDHTEVEVASTFRERTIEKICKAEKIEILGQFFPVVTLPENTPLLFQWFSLNEEAKIPDSYYANLEQACKLESGREIGLLISGHRISTYDRIKFSDLTKKFTNFRLIDFDLIDTKEFNYELSEPLIREFYQKNPRFKTIVYQHLYEKLQGGLSDFKVLTVLEQNKFYEYFDAARFFAMLMAGDLFKTSDDHPSGCIYLDLDMAIKSQLGVVKTVDGFSCYFRDSGYILVENGILAVDKPRHPVLIKTLEEMKKDSHGYETPAPRVYGSYRNAVHQHYLPKEQINEMGWGKCELIKAIAFSTTCLDADQSAQNQGSVWSCNKAF